MTYYRYLQHYYEMATAALRLYYRSADYTSLHHSTRHYSDYSNYKFRGKVPEFADGQWHYYYFHFVLSLYLS